MEHAETENQNINLHKNRLHLKNEYQHKQTTKLLLRLSSDLLCLSPRNEYGQENVFMWYLPRFQKGF